MRAAASGLSALDDTAESAITDAETAFDHLVADDPLEASVSESRLCHTLLERGIRFGGTPLPTSLKPLFVSATSESAWVDALERFLALLERVVSDHIANPEFHEFLGLTPLARELVSIDPGYPRVSSICRPDALFIDSRVSLLEVNADSPAMMTCADYVELIQRSLYPNAPVAEQFGLASGLQRTPALLRALLDAYRAWGGRRSSPTIAIVDWGDESTLEEQRLTAAAFIDRGCPTLVCDPRELTIENGQLRARDQVIDIVQRRVLFPDFISRTAELEPLITAYREGYACVVNPLRSILVGHKASLAWLEKCADSLTLEERQLIADVLPSTRVVATTGRERLINQQSRWVLKPTTGHGGKGVMIGAGTPVDRWRNAIDSADGDWIVQEFRKPIRYRLPEFDGGRARLTPFFTNWNPFFFGGKFGGAIGRASVEPVVNIRAGGALLPVIRVG